MPECRYAKLLQVLCRQAQQDRFVNLVLAEDRLVLSEASARRSTSVEGSRHQVAIVTYPQFVN
jgi:hypothetical protein